MDKILILNGTISEIPIIKYAQEMGYYVITSGNMPELPGHQVADQYIPADYSNEKEILNLVKQNGVQGIISCANDFGSITCSYVAEKMGWAGHDSYENALIMHRKDRLMSYFRIHNIPAPWFQIFETEPDAVNFCRECQYPIIVKANDLTGGKGIHRAENFSDSVQAIKEAFRLSRDKHVLVEPFLDGIQQSIVVFLIDGKIKVTSSSNVYCMKNPYLVQAETYPAENFDSVKQKLYEIIEFMAEDMKLVDGILSFQYIVQDGVPYIIDMMRRCFGNETLLLADAMTGFPWEKAYIKASLGLPYDNIVWGKAKVKYCGHYGVMADQNGILEGYDIPEDIKKKCFKKTVNIHPGETIHNYMTEKIEHIYFEYDNYEQMNQEILEYNNRIYVRVKD